MIFFKFSGYIFFYYFIKNPQITIALTFLTYIIPAIGGVSHNKSFVLCLFSSSLHLFFKEVHEYHTTGCIKF